MAGRSRMPPPHIINPGVRGPPPGPGIMRPGPGGPYQVRPQIVAPQQVMGGAPPIILEQKIATQNAEIQRLLTENQRLAATHVALRQELAAAQQELQRLNQMWKVLQSEMERQISTLVDKNNKQEAELRSSEAIKSDVMQLRADNQKLHAVRTELMQQVQQVTAELQRLRSDGQQVAALRTENEGLRQELQRARTALDYEKKANSEQLEQRQAMEKNLVSMAREVEKLRAELTNAEKRARVNTTTAVGTYNGGYAASDITSYGSVPQGIYADGYGIHQMPVAVENGVQYSTGPNTAWGAYELQRTGIPHEPPTMANGQGSGDSDYKGGTETSKYPGQDNHFQAPIAASQDQFRPALAESKPAEEWTVHEAPNGRPFYYNPATGATQWDKPAALIAAEAAQHFNQAQMHHPSQSQSGPVHLQSSGPTQMQQSIPGQGLHGQSGTSQLPQAVSVQVKQENLSPQVHLTQPAQSPAQQSVKGQMQPLQGQLQQPGAQMQQSAPCPLPHTMQGSLMPRPLPLPLPRPGQLHGLAPIPHAMQHPSRGPLPQPVSQPHLIPRPVQPNPVGGPPVQTHPMTQTPHMASQGSAPLLAAPPHTLQQPPHGPHVSAPPIIHQRPPVHTPPPSKPPAPVSTSAPTSGPQGANLFVFGIPEDMGDQKLKDLFAPYGTVLYAKVGVEKETGRGKGYGFVSMDSSKAAEAAIQQVNGMSLSGKRIKVELKRGEHEPHQQQSHQQPHQQQPTQQNLSGGVGPTRWHHSDSRVYRPY